MADAVEKMIYHRERASHWVEKAEEDFQVGNFTLSDAASSIAHNHVMLSSLYQWESQVLEAQGYFEEVLQSDPTLQEAANKAKDAFKQPQAGEDNT